MSTRESKLRVLGLVALVAGIVIPGSIGVVRFGNRDRQLTPGVVEAARSLDSIPSDIIARIYPDRPFMELRDAFKSQLESGSLPVDSVRDFYQAYALWMRDGRWDESDVRALATYLGVEASP